MFAYGAGPCRPVDLVTGPGAIYTVAAKRLLKGVVGIDSEAGPTEIAILADDTADAAYVAADLISQAEHDPLAASVLVTPSERLADDVEAELDKQVLGDPARRADPHRADRPAVRRSCWSTTSSRASTSSTPTPPSTSRSRPRTPPRGPPGSQRRRDLRRLVRPGVARRLLRRLQPRAARPPAAPATPRASRCARSSSPCTSSTTRRAALAEVADHVVTLAEAEDLPGHGAAVRVRFED